jgi:hypothetical protein
MKDDARGQRIVGVELKGCRPVLEGQQLAMDVVAVGEESAYGSGHAKQFHFRLPDHPLQAVAPDESDEPRELVREGARQQGRGRAGQ